MPFELREAGCERLRSFSRLSRAESQFSSDQECSDPKSDGLKLTPVVWVMNRLPISAIVPTLDRSDALNRTLTSLENQQLLPAQIIIVDASTNSNSRDMLSGFAERLAGICSLRWVAAKTVGAAAQRNQGVAEAVQPVVWFFDDDVLFEPECVERLWQALDGDSGLGGVSAMITNQRYEAPGRVSRWMFRLMAGRRSASYAGRVIGPAINLLPEDRADLPEVVPVEWLNLGCTMYRTAALPEPPFPNAFRGYSIMEDLALSLAVGREWKLANARKARIFHDSQPGAHKSNPGTVAEMALLNRYYIMSRHLGRTEPRDRLRLLAWIAFMHVASLRSSEGRKSIAARLRGELRAVQEIRESGDWKE